MSDTISGIRFKDESGLMLSTIDWEDTVVLKVHIGHGHAPAQCGLSRDEVLKLRAWLDKWLAKEAEPK